MTKLTDVEGIGPAYAAKLQAAGCKSQEHLLEMGGTKAGRKQIAADSGCTEKQVLEWVNRADLCRIKGVGSEYADLLECSGVDTVPELGSRKPENLHAKMTEVNAEKKLVRALPSLKQVTGWVEQAKGLPRAVHY
jgi:predicted flap endonuclease-1-like 5' DNA nuclease